MRVRADQQNDAGPAVELTLVLPTGSRWKTYGQAQVWILIIHRTSWCHKCLNINFEWDIYVSLVYFICQVKSFINRQSIESMREQAIQYSRKKLISIDKAETARRLAAGAGGLRHVGGGKVEAGRCLDSGQICLTMA